MTPSCVRRVCACTYNMWSPPRLHALSSPLPQPKSFKSSQQRVPQFPSWRSGLAGVLWSAKTSKTHDSLFKRGASVHVTAVREYLTSGVLYSRRSQLGGKKASIDRHAYLSLAVCMGDLIWRRLNNMLWGWQKRCLWHFSGILSFHKRDLFKWAACFLEPVDVSLLFGVFGCYLKIV